MSFERTGSTWHEVQDTSELLVNSIEEYVERWIVNERKTNGYLKNLNTPFLKSQDVLKVHSMLFEGITTFGGKTAPTVNLFGGFLGADPGMIKPELELLDKQMEKFWNAATTQDSKVRALAFQHARLVAIHPFKDGNGRTSRLVTQFGFSRLKFTPNTHVERDQYIKANNAAFTKNNIGRLAKVFAAVYDAPYQGHDLHLSPFRVHPARIESEMMLESSQLFDLSAINTPTTKKQWMFAGTNGWEKLFEQVNGKPRRSKAEQIERFQSIFLVPMTITNSVDILKELKKSGAIKGALFRPLRPEGYAEFANKVLNSAVEFGSDQQQEQFKDQVAQRLEGEETADLDDFALGVSAPVKKNVTMSRDYFTKTCSQGFSTEEKPE